MNTGIRRGELFNLTWQDVDLVSKQITVVGNTSKTGQTRYIPLNNEAVQALRIWQGHTKIESAVRYLGIEVDDALEMAEQTEI